MTAEIDVLRRAKDGETLQSYLDNWEGRLDLPATGLDRTGRLYRHYTRYNWDRYQRVMEEYTASEALITSARGISGAETWLYITEPWCADAAYSLPVIQGAAGSNSSVDLRILRRDENLEVMDQYLTGSARSIPILVTFDQDGNERARWGSKPEELAKRQKKLRDDGLEARELSAAAVEWYDAQGWLAIDRELAEALNRESMLAS